MQIFFISKIKNLYYIDIESVKLSVKLFYKLRWHFFQSKQFSKIANFSSTLCFFCKNKIENQKGSLICITWVFVVKWNGLEKAIFTFLLRQCQRLFTPHHPNFHFMRHMHTRQMQSNWPVSLTHKLFYSGRSNYSSFVPS